MDPLVRELEAITVLHHLVAKEFDVCGIPPKDEVHSRAAVGDEIDGRLCLGNEDRVVDRKMHRADDAYTFRDGSNSLPPK